MRHLTIVWAAALVFVFAVTASGTIFLYEDFEGGAPGWQTAGQVSGQSWSLWHLETNRSHGGSWSAAYNTGSPYYNYDVGTNWGILVSPWIDLSTASSVHLNFWSWLETENAPYEYDVTLFMLKLGGAPFVPLPPDIQTFPQGQWNHLTADLSALAGFPAVRLGFMLDTGDQYDNNYEGWYVDDVLLSDGETPPVPEPSTLLLLGTGLLGAGAVLRKRIRS